TCPAPCCCSPPCTWAWPWPSLSSCSAWADGRGPPRPPPPGRGRRRWLMSLEDLVAAAGLGGVILYGVLGGADFGGGVWDLFAGGPRRDEQRAAILRA